MQYRFCASAANTRCQRPRKLALRSAISAWRWHGLQRPLELGDFSTVRPPPVPWCARSLAALGCWSGPQTKRTWGITALVLVFCWRCSLWHFKHKIHCTWDQLCQENNFRTARPFCLLFDVSAMSEVWLEAFTSGCLCQLPVAQQLEQPQVQIFGLDD